MEARDLGARPQDSYFPQMTLTIIIIYTAYRFLIFLIYTLSAEAYVLSPRLWRYRKHCIYTVLYLDWYWSLSPQRVACWNNKLQDS